ncbi:MAG TPA: 3-phosphoserine/phosphohydroxythreonine transaminase [Tetragenococcus sp.]|nr:3-phosphoserine/phosphohydroxythreonine transaminase [Tetragenococcus sp.]
MTIYNFSAGPGVLPEPVLKKAQAELLDYQGSGMSVMELSHRSSWFEEIIQAAEDLLRELMAIPADYKVLFLQGGASLQFSAVPLNLAQGKKVQYVNTGSWAKKAIAAAQKLKNVDVKVIATSEANHFTEIPAVNSVDSDAAYLHITTNETIGGVSYTQLPDSGQVPLIADMSSNILANDYRVEDFGLIYAGSQKNIGPAGLTVVIVRQDLLAQADLDIPMLDYRLQAGKHSMYNTPPTFSIYMAKLVFEWLKDLGGVKEILRYDQKKAALLYDAIDASRLFNNPVKKADRSLMNIPFVTGDEALDKEFIAQAQKAGFENLKGHRSVGGMRASLYNAFPLAGVEALVDFMRDFEEKNGGK